MRECCVGHEDEGFMPAFPNGPTAGTSWSSQGRTPGAALRRPLWPDLTQGVTEPHCPCGHEFCTEPRPVRDGLGEHVSERANSPAAVACFTTAG